VRRTVPPSAEIEERIDQLLAVGVGENPRESLSELAKLGARLIIQRAVEDEFDAWLGRARYERRPEAPPGLRPEHPAHHRPRSTVRPGTAGTPGNVDNGAYEVPWKSPSRSRLRRAGAALTSLGVRRPELSARRRPDACPLRVERRRSE